MSAIIRPGRAPSSTPPAPAARASIASTVSNVCGRSPGPGTLCTFVPASTCATGVPPTAPSIVKASTVSAATPGASSYPIARASSRIERRSVAVARYDSLAIRSP